MSANQQWSLKYGASPGKNSCAEFRVWAPNASSMAVELHGISSRIIPLDRQSDADIFTARVQDVAPGTNYFYIIDEEKRRPDPASRLQPEGVYGPSCIVDPNEFTWTDDNWHGLALEDLIIYELHVGTFTPEGSFAAIIDRLEFLQSGVGITAIELMPVVEFPGARNWGYDGVNLYAPHSSYGGPNGLKNLINACHQKGLAVILDVVYNHLGPEGNYLNDYGPYFTNRYCTPWGNAINFDDANCDEVRAFFINNALYWLTEYHVDGLRLDAITEIYDFSAQHILLEMANAFHLEAEHLGRSAYLIAESDLNDSRIIRPESIGGYNIDAQWNDDFHHSLFTLVTGQTHGYYQDFGSLDDLRKAIAEGFVYDGRVSRYRRRRHGGSSIDRPGKQFIICNQNHDQIANASNGERLSTIVTLDQLKLMMTTLLCAPNIPLLFMGEEYGETNPFFYFTSFTETALAQAVSSGRRKEYQIFKLNDPKTVGFADPQAEETFTRSKLDWNKIKRAPHKQLLHFSNNLIGLRKELRTLANCRKDLIEITSNETLRTMSILRRDPIGASVLILLNFSEVAQDLLPVQNKLTWKLELRSNDKDAPYLPSVLTTDHTNSNISLPPWSAAIYSEVRE